MNEDYYDDWLNDNIDFLRHEYCEENCDEFHEYCKKKFIER